jgi:hypothetical protein
MTGMAVGIWRKAPGKIMTLPFSFTLQKVRRFQILLANVWIWQYYHLKSVMRTSVTGNVKAKNGGTVGCTPLK